MSRLSKQYLFITFFTMLLCWGSCVLCSILGIALSDHYFLYIPYLLGGFSPTIASYIALKKNQRVRNFGEWLKLIFDFRRSIFSYLLLPVLAAAFIAPMCLVSGFECGAPFFSLVFMIPMMLLGGGLEEAGWRCILQPELEKRYGFTLSTIIVSIIWWLWHLPLFFIEGVSQYGADFFAFGINVLGLSFALGAIRKVTGSVWLCVLFHCIINALHGVYIVGDSIAGNIAAAAVTITLSYILVFVHRKTPLFS